MMCGEIKKKKGGGRGKEGEKRWNYETRENEFYFKHVLLLFINRDAFVFSMIACLQSVLILY